MPNRRLTSVAAARVATSAGPRDQQDAIALSARPTKSTIDEPVPAPSVDVAQTPPPGRQQVRNHVSDAAASCGRCRPCPRVIFTERPRCLMLWRTGSQPTEGLGNSQGHPRSTQGVRHRDPDPIPSRICDRARVYISSKSGTESERRETKQANRGGGERMETATSTRAQQSWFSMSQIGASRGNRHQRKGSRRRASAPPHTAEPQRTTVSIAANST